MKALRNILCIALLTVVGNAFGDKLKVADFSVKAGKTVMVSVDLDNPDNQYIMTEFWISLPDGISIATDNHGEFLAEEGTRFDNTHNLSISKEKSSNAYHFLIYSSKNKPLKGSSGSLFTLTLTAASNVATGKYQGKIYGQIFSDPDKKEHNPSDVTFSVTVAPKSDIIPGDINCNGEVDDEDVDAFIELYLDDEIPEDDDEEFARFDANGDGLISLADAVAIFYLSNGLNYDGTDPYAARVERQ